MTSNFLFVFVSFYLETKWKKRVDKRLIYDHLLSKKKNNLFVGFIKVFIKQ